MTLADLIKKLETEQYETSDPKYSALEVARRSGWNSRARELLACLRLEQGLAEIQAAQPIDLRFKAALTGFDLSEQDGEG